MSVQSWFNRIWYGHARPPWWLVPPSLVYGAVAAARRLAYAGRLRRVTRIACPVVVVGNLSVGGTGKTPLVCWLVARLQDHGYRPGVVTRGYGGSARHPRRASVADDPRCVGDEAVLLAQRTAVPVAVGRDRPAAARLLVEAGCDVIVSDDGLQHYALARDCELVVIDGGRRFGNGWLLPAGPLRETPARLRAADATVVNGGGAALPGAFCMRLEAQHAVALRGGETRPLQTWAGVAVHAVAGIGHPERFFNLLRSYGIDVVGHPLDDHAPLAAGDLEFGDGRPVLMTEKDAVKCAGFADERHWFVPVSARFDGAEPARLFNIVMAKISKRGHAPPGVVDG